MTPQMEPPMTKLLANKEALLRKSFKFTHVAYFIGVASGFHEVSSVGATIILVIMTTATVLHISLEG